MTDAQKLKLKQFANDLVMFGAVSQTLLNAFLVKRSGEDTEAKAARFVATELLAEAIKELEKFKSDEKGQEPIRQQVGL